MSLLHQHAWPGNVRELRNAMERAAALATGAEVLLTHLPERIFVAAARGAVARSPLAPSGDDPLPAEVIELLRGPRGPSADDFRHFILRTESALIASALEASGGNKTAASRSLGMPLRTLKERLRGEGTPPDPTLTEALERVVPASESLELRQRVRRYELALIGWALREASGSRTEAARLLRIPERTLRERLREGAPSI
jgi:DNA-binding NtrC family response regulator